LFGSGGHRRLILVRALRAAIVDERFRVQKIHFGYFAASAPG
jgi:hypothetical protein